MKANLNAFEERELKITGDIKDSSSKSIILSIVRFATFILAISTLVWSVANKASIIGFSAACFFFAFIMMCFVHEGVRKKQNYFEMLSLVNSQYIARINGDFNTLGNAAVMGLKRRDDIEAAMDRFSGKEYFDANHDYCLDLDLFGRKSVFSLYNVSETAIGRQAFANELLGVNSGKRNVAELVMRQKSVEELGKCPFFLERYQAIARDGGMERLPQALMDFSANGRKPGKAATAVMCIGPCLWIVPLVMIFINPSLAGTAALGVIAINIIFWVIGLGANSEYLRSANGMSNQVRTMWRLFMELEKADFKSELLSDLIGAGRTSDSLFALSTALFFASLRNQPLFALLLNSVLPLDYFVSFLMGKWSEKYGSELSGELDNLGQIEAMMCAAQVMLTSANSNFPQFVASDEPSDNAYFKGEQIVHPLLSKDSAVPNSVTINSDIALITGSNMSGKTTLIRTVGVSCILAYTGAPVNCDSLVLGRMRIMSSMRIVDSLEDNISTFKAELIRISGIIKGAGTGLPMLFLIDEIFRGTNSDDRTEGALTVLHNLSLPHICGMMTTHDYAMIDRTCEKFDNIVYYHFSEHYTDSGITFDYMLREGISRESNARYLMRLVGIV